VKATGRRQLLITGVVTDVGAAFTAVVSALTEGYEEFPVMTFCR
jgi:isochorismate hydrolase